MKLSRVQFISSFSLCHSHCPSPQISDHHRFKMLPHLQMPYPPRMSRGRKDSSIIYIKYSFMTGEHVTRRTRAGFPSHLPAWACISCPPLNPPPTRESPRGSACFAIVLLLACGGHAGPPSSEREGSWWKEKEGVFYRKKERQVVLRQKKKQSHFTVEEMEVSRIK